MNRIDPLVKLAQQEPIPSLPQHFEEGVWRRIRTSGASEVEESSLLDQLLSMMFEPRFALAVCIVGIGIGTLWSLPQGRQDAGYARSVGLEVFSGNAPDLPSTLIAQRR